MNETIKRKLANLPTKPGVYLHKDERGKVLYVGKAKNLRNRVRSYFQAGKPHDAKTAMMVSKVADLDLIVTSSEVEALLVESNFIKQYRPPYNVVLRDDKQYLFVKMTMDEDWPRVLTTRNTTDKGARYFGPYTSAGNLRASLKFLRRIFPWCDDAGKIKDVTTNRRPCFNHRIGLCPGACVGKISPEDYRADLDRLARVLQGDTKAVAAQLKEEMQTAAAEQRFERAAALRDHLEALESLRHSQQAIDIRGQDRDVIGYACDEGQAVVILLTVRDGKVVARKEFTFWGTGGSSKEETVDSFLGQYYKMATDLPNEVLVPFAVSNASLVAEYLTTKQGRNVSVTVPQRGGRRKLTEMAQQNAEEYLSQLRDAWIADQTRTEAALGDLSRELSLSTLPQRIECYDISNLTGTSTVASMVVFVDAQAAKAHYRRFQIKHVKGIDDFASMREVLRRRFHRVLKKETGAGKRAQGLSMGVRATDESFEALPDLIIIDGGKGQVSAASEVMEELGLEHLPMIGLAKRLEEVVRLDQATGEFSVQELPHDSPGLYLLQRIRDEAHRFAITYNRNLRSKQGIRSALDEIPGIGPVKKKQLMRKFGSVRAIREADIVDIQSIVGSAAGQVVKENL